MDRVINRVIPNFVSLCNKLVFCPIFTRSEVKNQVGEGDFTLVGLRFCLLSAQCGSAPALMGFSYVSPHVSWAAKAVVISPAVLPRKKSHPDVKELRVRLAF